MSLFESRYSTVTRRAFLGGLSAAAIAGVVGCASGSAASSSPAGTAGGASGTTTPTTSSAAGASSGELPAGAQATVSWTFASSGGRARNPYMAVWIEDSAGDFVQTIALYHKRNGDNWLDTLSAWYEASGGTDTTTSGTETAGSFTAVWDGSTADGDRAAQGAYYVCVESVVEHGEESLVREQVELGSASNSVTLPPSGDITAAAVDYTV